MSDVIHAIGLRKSYGDVRAVADIDLIVAAGGVHGLLGPNGSGKSTTVRMLLGLIRPDAGEIQLFGETLSGHAPALLRRVGALVESPAFLPYLSGRDNLTLLQTYRGVDEPEIVNDALRRVRLQRDANRRFQQYSLGMKQRLGIAAALLGDPEMIVLDEPTNGLDPAGMREIRELIRELAREGRSVVLCSHLLHEVEQVCDHVSIFDRGTVVRTGRVTDLTAGSGSLVVEVADVDAAIQALRGSRWANQVRAQNGLVVIDEAAAAGEEISELLSQQHIFPRALRPQSRTLEDVYIEATLRETTPDA